MLSRGVATPLTNFVLLCLTARLEQKTIQTYGHLGRVLNYYTELLGTSSNRLHVVTQIVEPEGTEMNRGCLGTSIQK